MSRFDPDGRDWYTDEDAKKAKQLQKESKNQVETLNRSNLTPQLPHDCNSLTARGCR